MSGSVNDLCLQVTPLQFVAFAQKLVNFGKRRRLDAEECGLHVHGLIERNIVAMHQNGSAGIIV